MSAGGSFEEHRRKVAEIAARWTVKDVVSVIAVLGWMGLAGLAMILNRPVPPMLPLQHGPRSVDPMLYGVHDVVEDGEPPRGYRPWNQRSGPSDGVPGAASDGRARAPTSDGDGIGAQAVDSTDKCWGKICRAQSFVATSTVTQQFQSTCIVAASLPTCNSLRQGSFQCDATNNCLTYCNGTSWTCLSSGSSSSTALTLYVDPTGSDSNPCTSSGASACLTIQGALNKFVGSAKTLLAGATVNVAAGNYAGATISGFIIDPSTQKTTAGIIIDGTLGNVTPTTGSATGTATSGTAGGGSGFATLTDSGATWTVNDAAMVGKLMVLTGGTGAGQVSPITSNTATTITVVGSWTAPTGTTTYAIQAPTSVITTAAAAIPLPQTGTSTAAAGLQIVDNVTGGSTITIRNIGVSIAATSGIVIANSGSVNLIQTLVSSTTATAYSVFVGNTVSMTACASSTTSGGGLNSMGSFTTVSKCSFVGTSGNAAVGSVGGLVTLNMAQLTGTGGFNANSGAVGRISNSRINCLSLANSYAICSGTAPASLTNSGPSRVSGIDMTASVDVTNCTFGLVASGLGAINLTSTSVLSGNALTYGANAVFGGIITAPTAATTITGATAEMSVDTGSDTDTWVSLPASTDCLSNLSTGSSICRL